MSGRAATEFSANGDYTFKAGADDMRITVSGDYGGGSLAFIDNDAIGELTLATWTTATDPQSQIIAFGKGTSIIARLSGATTPALKLKAVSLCSTI